MALKMIHILEQEVYNSKQPDNDKKNLYFEIILKTVLDLEELLTAGQNEKSIMSKMLPLEKLISIPNEIYL